MRHERQRRPPAPDEDDAWYSLPAETVMERIGTDAVLIGLILLANGVFGFVQDYRAEWSFEALQQTASPKAAVVRDGKRRTVDAKVVEQDDAVPAAARLLEVSSLEPTSRH